jgi:hypothetical protein
MLFRDQSVRVELCKKLSWPISQQSCFVSCDLCYQLKLHLACKQHNGLSIRACTKGMTAETLEGEHITMLQQQAAAKQA